MQVCGNVESVKFLSEWLRLWHDRDSQSIKDSSISNKGNNLDEDDDYCGCTSDSDDNDENRLKNVLLVTGPIGVSSLSDFFITHACKPNSSDYYANQVT